MSAKNQYGLSSADYAKLYGVWRNMIRRCTDTQNDRYYTYGARGVSVCNKWRTSFHGFAKWAIANGWKPGLWIERKNVDGNYCPENCTFLSRNEQMRNKTSNIRITIEGSEKCLAEWCEIFGVAFTTAWARYRNYGYTDPDLLFYTGDLRKRRRCLCDRHRK